MKLFVSIIYIARCGVIGDLAKKVLFVNGILDEEFRSEIRNVNYALVYVFKFTVFGPHYCFVVVAFVVVIVVVLMSLSRPNFFFK
jgi:hypothetical protein